MSCQCTLTRLVNLTEGFPHGPGRCFFRGEKVGTRHLRGLLDRKKSGRDGVFEG